MSTIERRVPRASWPSRLIPLALVVIALVITGWLSYRHYVMYPGTTGPRPVFPTAAVGEGVTWADVIATHDGETRGLRDAVLDTTDPAITYLVGPLWLYARFEPATGRVTDSQLIGWPAPWITISTHIQYQHAPKQEDIVPMAWGDWRGALWERQTMFYVASSTTPATSLVVRHWIKAPNICLSIMVLLSAYAAVILAWRVARGRPRARTRLAIFAFLCLLLGVATAATMRTTTMTELRPIQTIETGWSPGVTEGVDLGLTLEQVRTDDSAAMDQMIAGAILAAIAEPHDDDVLAVAFSSNVDPLATGYGVGGWPVSWLFTADYSKNVAPGYAVDLLSDFMVIDTPGRRIGVNLSSIATIALACVMLWNVTAGAQRLLAWRRTRRRIARGLCVGCAYPKPAPAAGDDA